MVGQAEAVVLGLGSQLTIRNLTLLNTATQPASARSATPDPLQDFSTALWALGNISSDSSVTLDLVTLVIPQQELALLHLFASGASTCGCSLNSNTQATLSRIFDASLETGLQPLHPKPGFRHNSQGSSWVPGSDGVTGSQAGVDKVASQASSDLLGFLWESADAHKEGNGSQTWMDLLPDDPDSQLAEQAQQLVTGYTHGNDPFGRQGAEPDIQVPTPNGEELAAEAAPSLPAVEGAGPLVPPAPLDLLFVGRISHHEADKGVPIGGASALGALPGNCLPPAIVSENSAVRLSSFGTSSIGSGASRIEESSMAMMSDSFDRPGSEYGDWRNLGAESDKLLMQAKCDVGQGGRLTISDVLGAGAHGVVYRGEWRGRPVAVKCLLFQEHRIHTKRQALQEAAINTKLAHPNIVNTYTFDLRAVGTNNDMLVAKSAPEKKDGHMSIAEDQAVAGDWKMYIVQEYCDGGHLKRAVDSAALTEDGSTPNMLAVVNMALDIACGVQHIHSKNIIHGDLSPANILLKLDDSRPGCLKAVAKVGDFGLSHMSKDGQSHVSNVRQGTPFYTAPE
ncbi:protein kinase domain-containing protein, partial [Haematococcus lacustris]